MKKIALLFFFILSLPSFAQSSDLEEIVVTAVALNHTGDSYRYYISGQASGLARDRAQLIAIASSRAIANSTAVTNNPNPRITHIFDSRNPTRNIRNHRNVRRNIP